MNCLITGGTSGVGLSIARCALEQGHRVIIVGSNDHSCLETKEALNKDFPDNAVDAFATDLSTFEGVQNLIHWLDETISHLDVLYNCAGIVSLRNETTSDGVERIWATNYLSVLRTSLLCLPLLKKSDAARIFTVSGTPLSLKGAQFNSDDVELQQHFSATQAILQSILCRVLFTFKLAQELEYCNIKVHTFHPGFVRSNLARHLPLPLRFAAKMASIALAPGSKTGCYLLDAQPSFEQSGLWFKSCKPVQHKLKQVNQQNMDRLWSLNDNYMSSDQPT